MKPDFNNIINQFMFDGRYLNIIPYGHGHINDTYAATFSNSANETHRYILQRINHNVF